MRRWPERAALVFAWATGLGLLVGIAALIGVLVQRGGPVLGPSFLFGDTPAWEALTGRAPVFGGIWPAVAGTLALVGLATAFAVPIGVASGIYLSEYAPPRTRRVFDLGVDMLSGVPSIVMGLFGFALILFLRRTVAPHAQTCLLLSGLCIGLLVLPYLIRTTQSALQGVPENVRLVGPSLGFTRWQGIRFVLLPHAVRGILAGVMLAIGRAAEDTAVIMLTGAVWNAGLPSGLSGKYEALPFRIYVTASEYQNQDELAQGFGAALVLLLITVGMFGVSVLLHRGMERRWSR